MTVCPAKTQISLGIREDSDQTGWDAQADLSLRWAHSHFVGFGMRGLEFVFYSLVEPLEGYEHDDFYSLTAKYKFTLAMENAHCNDYVTEKLWRPFMLGSVPIISGSSRIRVSCFNLLRITCENADKKTSRYM